LKRFAMFIDVAERGWVNHGELLGALSRVDPLSIVVARQPIILGGRRLVDEYCSSMQCIAIESADALKRALDKIVNAINNVLREIGREAMESGRIPSTASSRVEDAIRGAISAADRDLARASRVVCRDIAALGCYIPSHPVRIYGETFGPPAIVIDVESIEEMVLGVARELELDKYDRESLLRDFLTSIVVHELTHSFTDMSPSHAPAKRFRKVCGDLYHRIIEEGLATYYQLKQFLESYDRASRVLLTARLLNGQSLEYRAGLAMFKRMELEHVRNVFALWTRIFASEAVQGLYLGPLMTATIMGGAVSPYDLLRLLHSLCDWLRFYELHRHYGPVMRQLAALLERLACTLWLTLEGVDPGLLEEALWRILALSLASAAPSARLVS